VGRNRVIWSLFIWIKIFLIVIHSHDTESLTTCIPFFLTRHRVPLLFMSDSSRNWWSRSKSGSPQKSAGISLNSIASAIGLKSKKQGPSLIQDPPSSSTHDGRSTARSRVDSIGPPTPANYECQTTSDNDPFAARQNIPPAPQIPSQKTLFNDLNSCAPSINHACDPTLSSTTRKLTHK
jgi:hypothetical protein